MPGPSEGREGPSLLLSALPVVRWPSGRPLAHRRIALTRLRVAFSLSASLGPGFLSGRTPAMPDEDPHW